MKFSPRQRGARWTVPSGVIALLILLAGCGAPEAPRNIIWVTLDTTRADHLGCYGHTDASTPNMDALAAEGTLFLEAQSQVPVTFPSHSTMFTGRYPPAHGVRYNGMFHLADTEHTIAERLREAGWSTWGVPAAYPLTTSTGIGQGFSVYRDMFGEKNPDELKVNAERDAKEIADIGIDILRETSDNPFFLWLHFFDPHYPYEPPFPWSSRFRDAPYDGEIAYVDEQIGRLLQALEDLGHRDDTLVIIVGDHGEGLYDHDEKMHSNLAYQSTLHVPLIMRQPGAKPFRVTEPVSLADLAPTVLDLLGLPRDGMDGISLASVFSGKEPPRRSIYFEAIAGSLVYGWSPLEGIRRGPWKYIRSSAPELFDLGVDPGEVANRYTLDRDRARDLEAELDEQLLRWSPDSKNAAQNALPMDPREQERLASLGYVGGSVSSARKGGPSPASLVDLEVEVLSARELMQGEDWRGALRIWLRVLERDHTNRHALQQAAIVARRIGDESEAERLARDTLKIYPEFMPARFMLGEILGTYGRADEAVEILREGLQFEEGSLSQPLRYRLAIALIAAKRMEEVEHEVDLVIDAGTDYPSFFVLRALCHATFDRTTAAEVALSLAFDGGYRDYELLQQEPHLAALRNLPNYDRLIEKMMAN